MSIPAEGTGVGVHVSKVVSETGTHHYYDKCMRHTSEGGEEDGGRGARSTSGGGWSLAIFWDWRQEGRQEGTNMYYILEVR